MQKINLDNRMHDEVLKSRMMNEQLILHRNRLQNQQIISNALDIRRSFTYCGRMDTNTLLSKVTKDSATLTNQTEKSPDELNNAISFISSSVEELDRLRPTRKNFLKKGLSYDGLLTDKVGNTIAILVLIGYMIAPCTAIGLASGGHLNQVSMMALAGAFGATVCVNAYLKVVGIRADKLVATLEEKGKLNPIRSTLMRLLLTKTQWAKLNEATSEMIRYNNAVKAWERHVNEVQFGEEFENALQILNNNSPRKELYRNIHGGISSRDKNIHSASYVEADLREWMG